MNSTLLVALANKEIIKERKTTTHHDILTEARASAENNSESHVENVNHLENILSKIQS